MHALVLLVSNQKHREREQRERKKHADTVYM